MDDQDNRTSEGLPDVQAADMEQQIEDQAQDKKGEGGEMKKKREICEDCGGRVRPMADDVKDALGQWRKVCNGCQKKKAYRRDGAGIRWER